MRLMIPSERNFEIYNAVQTDRMSRRNAAARFGISPTRVQQIVAQVQAFVLHHGDEVLLEMPPELMEVGALNLCHQRLGYLYHKLMLRCQAAEEASGPAACVRFILAAARLTIEQTKIAGRLGKTHRTLLEEGLVERSSEPLEVVYEEDDEAAAEPAPPTPAEAATSPPAGGCTAPSAAQPVITEPALASEALTVDDDATCDQILVAMERRKRVQESEITPAQPRPKPR